MNQFNDNISLLALNAYEVFSLFETIQNESMVINHSLDNLLKTNKESEMKADQCFQEIEDTLDQIIVKLDK